MSTENSLISKLSAGVGSISDACVVLVKTTWNSLVTDELEKGAIKILKEAGVQLIHSISVPGAVELPFAVKYFHAHSTLYRPDAYITLGCVIRGETPHFDYVCHSVNSGITDLNLQLNVPVIFGVLTVDNAEQAADRIGGKHGHKGEEFAYTALKMIDLCRSVK